MTTTDPLIEQPELEVARLEPHPKNIRSAVTDIEDLAESIKARGVLQPLVVVPNQSLIHLSEHTRPAEI